MGIMFWLLALCLTKLVKGDVNVTANDGDARIIYGGGPWNQLIYDSNKAANCVPAVQGHWSDAPQAYTTFSFSGMYTPSEYPRCSA